MVKNFDDAYVAGAKQFLVEYNGEQKTFVARELGFFEVQELALKAIKSGLNSAALIVAASIETEDGKKFTYDEVLRLKKDFAKQFFDAANEVNPLGDTEKK